MREGRWDVIVVGAGLGGMTAALRLAREGLHILVVDAASHPGGTAYVYRRGDFLFPMGPLGCANPELVREILSRAGMEDVPPFQRVHYGLRAFGLSLPLSRPFRQTAAELSRLFPGEAAAIGRFFQDMKRIAGNIAPPSPLSMETFEGSGGGGANAHSCLGPDHRQPQDGPRELDGIPPHSPPGPGFTPPSGNLSAASYLDNLVRDRRLRRILGSMGTREPYSSLALLAAMWSLLCESGIHYPRGGFHGLSRSMAARLGWREEPRDPSGFLSRVPGGSLAREGKGPTAREGDVSRPGDTNPEIPKARLVLGKRVRRILVRKGRALGVVLEDGTRLASEAVVSNADFKNTFLQLVEPGELPPPFLARLRSSRLSSSNLQLCLGIDAAGADLSAFRECSRLVYRGGAAGLLPDEGGEEEGEGGEGVPGGEIDPSRLAGEEMEVCLLGADDPSLAPPGKAVLVIRVAVPYEAFAPFRNAGTRRTPGYVQYKNGLGLALLREASNLVPGLEEAMEVMDVATPLTFEERGGRHRGAVAGWTWTHGKNLHHPVELVRTPVTGLFMAGHQAFSMLALGGIPTAVFSGLLAAEHVLKGSGPVEDMKLPGTS